MTELIDNILNLTDTGNSGICPLCGSVNMDYKQKNKRRIRISRAVM